MRSFLMLALFLVLYGCSPIKSTSEDERHQAELTLHEMQTKVDDFQHDLNCYKTEFQILESKLDGQQGSFAQLKEKFQKEYQEKIDVLIASLKEMEKKNQNTEKRAQEAVAAVKDLFKHAEKTSLALQQYQSKIGELEKTLVGQSLQLEEIKKIKGTLEELAVTLKEENNGGSVHRVSKGESLEKIAKQYNVSINNLKKINHLDEDLIMIGQELKIPSR